MKEVEITSSLDLDNAQTIALDTHSFLNVVNILTLELMNVSLLGGEEITLTPAINYAIEISRTLQTAEAIDQIHKFSQEQKDTQYFSNAVSEFFKKHPELHENEEAIESRENIESVQEILEVRIRELLARVQDPQAWTAHSIPELANNFTNVLAAIEKNSKGRYRIIYNIAAQENQDYYVDLKIESIDAPNINMPPVLQDVFRDLIANARKYTPQGGRISAGLCDNGKNIVLTVEDNGCGIPEDEIEKVVEFGKRARNTMERRTMGGGFGLTKAYFVTKQFGGRMWIRSGEGSGTRITINIPRKE